MAYFDVFNGDADGMCALLQLRLAEPRDAQRITGLKREIALLQRVRAQAGDTVTVLDISLDANRAALMSMLRRGAAPSHPARADRSGATDLHRHDRGPLSAWQIPPLGGRGSLR
jgi:hypothetical protein